MLPASCVPPRPVVDAWWQARKNTTQLKQKKYAAYALPAQLASTAAIIAAAQTSWVAPPALQQ
jgi:hypothetical protein